MTSPVAPNVGAAISNAATDYDLSTTGPVFFNPLKAVTGTEEVKTIAQPTMAMSALYGSDNAVN